MSRKPRPLRLLDFDAAYRYTEAKLDGERDWTAIDHARHQAFMAGRRSEWQRVRREQTQRNRGR